jgi:hypothetical protein
VPERDDTWTTAHINAGRVACYRLATIAADSQQYVKACALANLAEDYPHTALELWHALNLLGVGNASYIVDQIKEDQVLIQARIEEAARVNAARSRGRSRNR